MHYVYITTNKINNKKYIGQRIFDGNKTTPENDNYFGSGTLLVRAIKKYGSASFSKEILCICKTQKEVDEKEIYYIDKFEALDKRDEFYNRAEGGQYNRSENHSKSMSKRMSHYYSHPELWSEKHRAYKWKMTVNKIHNKIFKKDKSGIASHQKKKFISFRKTINRIYRDVEKKKKQAYMKTDEYKKKLSDTNKKGGLIFKERLENDPVFKKEWNRKNRSKTYKKVKKKWAETNKDKSIIHRILYENNLNVNDLFPDWNIYSYLKGRYKSDKYLVPFVNKTVKLFKSKNIDVSFDSIYNWYIGEYGTTFNI